MSVGCFMVVDALLSAISQTYLFRHLIPRNLFPLHLQDEETTFKGDNVL